MSRKRRSRPEKGSGTGRAKGSAPTGPLTRGEKRRILQQAARLDREGPWLLYKHGSSVSSDVLWTTADHCRALRAEVRKRPRDTIDYLALESLARTVDRDLQQHFGRRRKSGARQSTEAIVVALAIAMFIRLFIFEPYRIPSGSMIPTLHVGDFIFVSKFTYGLQLPYTDYTFFAWRKPVRGEVVIFEHPLPEENDEILIKRVVAVAGDKVRLTNNVWMVNGEVLGKSKVVAQREPCRLSPGEQCTWRELPLTDEPGQAGCPCTFQHESSERHDWITQHIAPDVVCECTLPESEEMRTGPDGRTLMQQHINSGFWPAPQPFFRPGFSFLTHWPESHRAQALSEGADGLPEVTIPEGYVMVMGDNRDNSADGRYWGLVPLNKVRGKASFIWLATDNPFGRIFRLVH